jgi:hypothetical protein
MNMQKSGANTYNILAFVSILVISYLSLSGPPTGLAGDDTIAPQGTPSSAATP